MERALSKNSAPPPLLDPTVLFINMAFIHESERAFSNFSAPPESKFDFPFLKVKPLIFMVVAVTVQILFCFCASKIASSSPYFSKYKFLSMVNPMFLFPVYVPDAILIVSPLLASFNASSKFWNAVALLFPSPPAAAFSSTYHVADVSFKIPPSFSFFKTLLSVDNILFSLFLPTAMKFASAVLSLSE